MHDQYHGNGHAPHEDIAQLSHSLEKTLDQNRTLLTEMARFTKDESRRLAHMQLEYADHAFAKIHNGRNLTGLLDAQQEWIRQMMQEYASLSLRYAEMFHALTQHVRSHVENAGRAFQHQVQDEMDDLVPDHDEMPIAGDARTGSQAHLPAE